MRHIFISRRHAIALLSTVGAAKLVPRYTFAQGATPQSFSLSNGVDPRSYFSSIDRVVSCLTKLGSPLLPADANQISVLAQQNDMGAVERAESILDRYTLASVSIEGSGSVNLFQGGAERRLVEQGWCLFLLRVIASSPREMHGVYLGLASDHAPGRMRPNDGFPRTAQRATLMDTVNLGPLIEKMWLRCEPYGTSPFLTKWGAYLSIFTLSGLPVEYFIVQLFSRDAGSRRSKLVVSSIPRGGGRGAAASREFGFQCLPARRVALRIRDADGAGCFASLTIKDAVGRLYPPQVMRLAPDMEFQQHIYRADGETVHLPDGEYTLKSKRGPEYLQGMQVEKIDSGRTLIDVQLKRWIDPAMWGWYSGDVHIHAAGCAHYQVPTEGVSPETMIRHVRGEALSIADVLTWGPSWYYQKNFFSGRAESPQAKLEHPDLQTANNVRLDPRRTPKDSESMLRYDVEVSGFPSSQCGHPILLGLKEQDYPGATAIEQWPSWNLPILRWAKAQGAITGYAHCGAGMLTDSKDLPNYEIPGFDSIGINEALVDAPHGMVDFLQSGSDLPIAELNAWYHLLNCGFRVVMVGGTDYPCLAPPTDTRPGLQRTYVHLDRRPADNAGYEAWLRNLKNGSVYFGDGRTHFLRFTVNDHANGMVLNLEEVGTVTVLATIAAWLEPEVAADSIREAEFVPWHIEHARLDQSRSVSLELVINAVVRDRINLVADGISRTIRFKPTIERSSWIALRVLPSGHTHSIFVEVAGKPIRASKRSADWCSQSVRKLWEVKSPFMRESERDMAEKAFADARLLYDAIAAQCDAST